MIKRTFVTSLLLTTACQLAGCNDSPWTKPPNVTGSGVVESIEKITRSAWVEYDVKLSDANPPDLEYIKVSGSRIVASDILPSIGKRIAVKCYRDPHDYCYVSNYSYDGRNLDVESK